MSHVGFGIVGCGMIANFHAEAIKRMKGTRIAACFDSRPESADAFAAANPDVTVYQTTGGCRMKIEGDHETIIVKRIK